MTELFSDQHQPQLVGMQDGYLYWFNSASRDHLNNQRVDGAILRASLDGGNAEVLVEDLLVEEVDIDATHVYWLESRQGQDDTFLMRIPLDGSETATELGQWSERSRLALADHHICLRHDAHQITCMNKDDLETTFEHSWQPEVQDLLAEFFGTLGARVLWTDWEGGTSWALADGSDSPSSIAERNSVAWQEAGENLYWLEPDYDGFRMRTTNTESGTVLNLYVHFDPPNAPHPYSYHLTSNHAIVVMSFMDSGRDLRVIAVPQQPGESTTLLEVTGRAHSTVLNDGQLYWAEKDEGTIRRWTVPAEYL